MSVSRTGRAAAEYDIGRWFSLDYTFTTDDTGTKQGKPGHQVNVNVDYDLKERGGIGANVWAEWFPQTNGSDDLRDTGSLDEVDYSAYYRYEIKPFATLAKVGWIAETFPKLRGDSMWTEEAFVLLAFDDAKWFGPRWPALHPYVAYYQDVNEFAGGLFEWGLAHPVRPSELGLGSVPLLRDLTFTPSFLMDLDIHQQTGGTKWAKIRYGLETSYDLGQALKLPPKYGDVSLTAFLYYIEGLCEPFQDVLYGGVTLGFRL